MNAGDSLQDVRPPHMQQDNLHWLCAVGGIGLATIGLVYFGAGRPAGKSKSDEEFEEEFDRLFSEDDFVEEVFNTEATEGAESPEESLNAQPKASASLSEPAASASAEMGTKILSTTPGSENAASGVPIAQSTRTGNDAESVRHRSPGSRSLWSAPWVTAPEESPKPEGLSHIRPTAIQPLRSIFVAVCLLASLFCFWRSRPFHAVNQPAAASIASMAPATKEASPGYKLRSVAEFKPGDPILSFNRQTGEVEVRHVKRAVRRVSDHLRILTFTDRDGRSQTIKTTNEHPFLVVDVGDYVEARDLQPGQKVRGPTGELQQLVSST